MSQPYFIVNVDAAIFEGDRWLMCVRSEKQSHAGGLLSLVGGKVEYDDLADATLEAAVAREVQEETGLVVRPLQYVKSSSFVTSNGQHVIDIVFLCVPTAGNATICATYELAELGWMTLEEVLAHPKAESWLISSMEQAESLRRKL